MDKLTPQSLENIFNKNSEKQKNCIRVGMSTCGIAAGAEEVFKVLSEELKKRSIQIEIKKCGCVGMCFAEPLVEVSVEGLPTVIYGKINKEKAIEIVEKHIVSKKLVDDYIFDLEPKK